MTSRKMRVAILAALRDNSTATIAARFSRCQDVVAFGRRGGHTPASRRYLDGILEQLGVARREHDALCDRATRLAKRVSDEIDAALDGDL